tara:strand:+ start:191 stop:394 length:204 start_codon:yes stop_codon:yes gene_type:complete
MVGFHNKQFERWVVEHQMMQSIPSVVVKDNVIRTEEEMFQWMEERERVEDLIKAWREIQMDILIDLD